MNSQKDYMMKFLNSGTRFDGRKLEEYRKVSVEYGVSKNAEGSARVKIGKTEVLAGIKLSVGKPFPDTPNDGVLMVGAELIPMSNPEFESGPPGIQAIELARVIDRGIRESKAIDIRKLCIEKGEKVWLMSVDIVPVNDDGNLFDAAGLATVAALKDTLFPKYDGVEINYKEKTKEGLPMSKEPISITVIKIGDKLLIDPTTDEEKMIEARLTIASIKDKTICALQKGGEDPLTLEEIDQMVELGLKKAEELHKLL
ncbi:exosome complex protein Rrp42 [Candidatus Woesearchaeota archaeon]|nr:exosome complex protein Rrp42 [Candidatus Woesearchaeota archaeon]